MQNGIEEVSELDVDLHDDNQDGFETTKKNKREHYKDDYQVRAPLQTIKLVNKALHNIRAVYMCPLCARKHDIQDAFFKRQELGNHIAFGHEDWEIEEWLKELEDYAELKRGIVRY